MNERDLQRLMDDKSFVDSRIKEYLGKNVIVQIHSKEELLGHMAKAEHNLEFISDTNSKYNDWILVGCYYAIYHAALSLILMKGFFSKSHDATLCLLIKHFYDKSLSKEDIILVNTFDSQEMLFYVQSKQEREKASYSTKILFDTKYVNKIVIQSRLFVDKSKEIIKSGARWT